jgi:hypothetical protein
LLPASRLGPSGLPTPGLDRTGKGTGVTPSEEMVHISRMEVTPKLGKGAQDTWRLRWLRAAGLIKPLYRNDSAGEARLWVNQGGRGRIRTSV